MPVVEYMQILTSALPPLLNRSRFVTGDGQHNEPSVRRKKAPEALLEEEPRKATVVAGVRVYAVGQQNFSLGFPWGLPGDILKAEDAGPLPA